MTQLDVQHNELQNLPETIGRLTTLKRLGIRYNQLTELPASLSNCKLLDEFIVESNKLTSLPVSFWARQGVVVPYWSFDLVVS